MYHVMEAGILLISNVKHTMRIVFAVVTFLAIPSLSMAMDRFEGSWSYDVQGEDGVTSIRISRYGNTYVGEIEAGSRHGRIYVSKLKGWIQGEKLYARVCSEPDDADDDAANNELQECLEKSENLVYFTSDEKELDWYEKKGQAWKLV